MKKITRVGLCLAASFIFYPALAVSAEAGIGGLLRSSSGTIEYRKIGESGLRGIERWHLMVHPDGSRTLNTRVLKGDNNTRTTFIQRVDADFGPLHTFIERSAGGEFVGIGLFSRMDNSIAGLSRGPAGNHAHEVLVDNRFTLISHAVAADSWQAVPKDMEIRKTYEMTAYSIRLALDADPPILGSVIKAPIEWIGRETITVPAGRFETTRMRLADSFDVWFFGPDRTLARMLYEAQNREYLLTEYSEQR